MSAIAATPVLTRPAAFTSVDGASTYTSLSEKTIRTLIDGGKLVAHRVGGRVLIAFSDLDRLVTGVADSESA